MVETSRKINKQAKIKAELAENFPFLRSKESKERMRFHRITSDQNRPASGEFLKSLTDMSGQDARSSSTSDMALSDIKDFMKDTTKALERSVESSIRYSSDDENRTEAQKSSNESREDSSAGSTVAVSPHTSGSPKLGGGGSGSSSQN